ncbi:DNA replication/repair protein RecF [Oceanobacter mangrovi]|uniref:DNA replication/repair protein RecF n=1 Tax=Oceanobacter mangrovi TaxID=2862510 RepID=UPI001C8D6816|nr:DNA replication/repair protein RecF [Oceanobacter mangrovi]
MPIRQLSVSGVRNLAPLELTAHPSVNFIYGDNGSGKSSLLEAIALLSTGKSFRSNQIRQLINHDADRLELSCVLEDPQAADGDKELYSLRLKNGDVLFRLNGSVLTSQAEVATNLPVQVIEPNTFRLLVGSPEDRRQFLDWGVFHVEPGFIEEWRIFKKVLKQRNSVLKQKEESWLDAWDSGFVEASEKIHQYRIQYLEQFVPCFEETLQALDPNIAVRLHYYPGWERDSRLEEVLERQRERDLQLGYTQAGPHRAELRIRVDKLPAADVLSRGQQKTVVAALKLTQGILFKQHCGTAPIYLVDDLASELDSGHRLALCKLLEDLKCQVFITSIEKQQLMDSWTPQDYKVFHVERGEIREEPITDPSA